MKVLLVIPALFGILLLFGLAPIIGDWLCGTTWACGIFGWHNGDGGTQSFDGCSLHGVCSKCGKHVMQDSQGNWF